MRHDIFIKADAPHAETVPGVRDWGTSGRNPNRCLRHDDGKVRLDMIPVTPLWEIARVYEYGATKYQMDNWRKGTSWSRCFAACLRHLWKWWGGEDNDPESRISHLAHAAFWVFAFIEWTKTHPEHDDRPRTAGEREAELEIDEAFNKIAAGKTSAGGTD